MCHSCFCHLAVDICWEMLNEFNFQEEQAKFSTTAVQNLSVNFKKANIKCCA